MINRIIELLAVAGTIGGLYLLSIDNSNGFSIGAISNIFWIWHGYNLTSGGIGLTIVNMILFIINLNGMGVI
jgi:hypothetical protein